MVTVWVMGKWQQSAIAIISVHGVILKIETRFAMLVENDR